MVDNLAIKKLILFDIMNKYLIRLIVTAKYFKKN